MSKWEQPYRVYDTPCFPARWKVGRFEDDDNGRVHAAVQIPARLQATSRQSVVTASIAELEANLKRATAALKSQQLETTCECKNCMNATEAIEAAEKDIGK